MLARFSLLVLVLVGCSTKDAAPADSDTVDCDDPVDWYGDADGDGYGGAYAAFSSCEQPEGYVRSDADCADGDPSVHPGAGERCDEGDEDCDGLLGDDDPDLTDAPMWYQDGDGDGYGSSSISSCAAPFGYVSADGDCDDADADVNPAATERCDTTDSDCDGVPDNDDAVDRISWYPDGDGDGYGDEASAVLACSPPSGTTTTGGDCDDAELSVNPAATEICRDGIDNDCDGEPGGACRETGDIAPDDVAIASIGGDRTTGLFGFAIAVDDFDDDGVEDMILAQGRTSQLMMFPTTLTGDHDAADAPVILYGDALPIAAPGDMTGDGIADFVSCNPTADLTSLGDEGQCSLLAGPITASTLLTDAVGRFDGERDHWLGEYVATPGDIDGDGIADLWIGEHTSSRTSEVFLFSGGVSGDYDTSAAVTTIEESYFEAIFADDIDGDGVSDLLAQDDIFWRVFLGPPASGSYTSSAADASIRAGDGGTRIGAGDANDDGKDDIVYVGNGTTYILFTTPAGDLDVTSAEWQARVGGDNPYWAPGGQIVGTDFDGDGASDVFVADHSEPESSRLCGWYGPLTSGTFYAADADVLYATPGEEDKIGAAMAPIDDVTGDGVSELVVAAPYSNLGATESGAVWVLSLGML